MIGKCYYYGKRKVDVMSIASNKAYVTFLDNPKEQASVDLFYLQPEPYELATGRK